VGGIIRNMSIDHLKKKKTFLFVFSDGSAKFARSIIVRDSNKMSLLLDAHYVFAIDGKPGHPLFVVKSRDANLNPRSRIGVRRMMKLCTALHPEQP
jgi:RNase P protein component